MRKLLLAVVAVGLLAGPDKLGEKDDPVKQEVAKLQGTWVATSLVWGSDPIPLAGDNHRIVVRYTFAEDKFRSCWTSDGSSEDTARGTFRVNPSKAPKHLDLIPPEGADYPAQKCLYSLQGDELKIALPFCFAPGTPEQEKERGVEARRKRPKRLEPREVGIGDYSVMIVTLKRQENLIPPARKLLP